MTDDEYDDVEEWYTQFHTYYLEEKAKLLKEEEEEDG